ncbi:MAG: hypothetical protein FWD97_00115 [Defluviitaleaceae bacterium]|nr:hypothetical protein [Defluviitaleaceae bacterium]
MEHAGRALIGSLDRPACIFLPTRRICGIVYIIPSHSLLVKKKVVDGFVGGGYNIRK